MQVIHRVGRELSLDDVLDVRNVHATRRGVGAHERRDGSISQRFQSIASFLRAHVGVEGRGAQSLPNELRCDLLARVGGVDKHQRALVLCVGAQGKRAAERVGAGRIVNLK